VIIPIRKKGVTLIARKKAVSIKIARAIMIIISITKKKLLNRLFCAPRGSHALVKK
jgi:hypothetical protein